MELWPGLVCPRTNITELEFCVGQEYPCSNRLKPLDFGPINHSDRKSTRLNSSHLVISYAVFCLKKKNTIPFVDRPPSLVSLAIEPHNQKAPASKCNLAHVLRCHHMPPPSFLSYTASCCIPPRT